MSLKDTVWFQPTASNHGDGAISHKSSWWRWRPSLHSATGSEALGRRAERSKRQTGNRKKRGRKVHPPVKPPSAMLNMNLCLEAFFFSSLMLTADAAVPPSLPFSPFCSFPQSSVFIPSFSSFCSATCKKPISTLQEKERRHIWLQIQRKTKI